MKIKSQLKWILLFSVLLSCDMPVETHDDLPDELEDPIIGGWRKIAEVTHVLAVTDLTQIVVDYKRPMSEPVRVVGSVNHSLFYFVHGYFFLGSNYGIELTERAVFDSMFNIPSVHLSIIEEDSSIYAEFHTEGSIYKADNFTYSFDRVNGLFHIPFQNMWSDNFDTVSVACSTLVPLFDFNALDTTNLYTFEQPLASRNLEYLHFFDSGSLHLMQDTLGLDTTIGDWNIVNDSLILNYGRPYNEYKYSVINDTLTIDLRIDDSIIEGMVQSYEQLEPNSLIDAWFSNSARWVRL